LQLILTIMAHDDSDNQAAPQRVKLRVLSQPPKKTLRRRP
jgi:hypothetical protein